MKGSAGPIKPLTANPTQPRLCALIPVYNHGLTVRTVISGAKRFLPVIVIDDGSTDETGEAVAGESGISVVRFPENRGKGAALRAGFSLAESLGYSHVVTLDADGQHPVEALAEFEETCRREPEAFIVGVRDLQRAGAPFLRRFSNALSSFWFRCETGVKLPDTLCGYRVYPLRAVRELKINSERYAFELEVMVKAAWAGIPLRPKPVQVDYASPTSRLSHFHPLADFLAISRVHFRLVIQTCFHEKRAAGARGTGKSRDEILGKSGT